MYVGPHWKSSRERREEGASLVEFAIIAPLLLLLVFGMVEFGLAFKDRLTVSSATAAAARIGSVVGNEADADYAALQALTAGLNGAFDPSDITRVVIYKSDSSGSFSAGDANYYLYDGSNPLCTWDPCPQPGANFEGYGAPSNWGDPATRNTLLPDPDVFGVRIEFQHEWMTTILPWMSTPANWTDDARVRLEPDVTGP